MSRKQNRGLPLLAIALICASNFAQRALAAEDHYVCTIKTEYELRDDGTLGIARLSEQVAGQRFVVDRLTGIVRGKFITTAGANNVVVVDRGSSQNSFKSYWTHPRLASSPVAYLEIRTYRGEKPPFFVINNSGAYTGTCD